MCIAIFLRFGIPDLAVRDSFDGEIRCRGENDEPAARRSSGRPVSPAVERDHQSSPSAGAAGGEIDWDFLAGRFSSVCGVGPGQPPLPTRLVAGLFILKHTHNLSDEALCDRWVENPYFQYFCGKWCSGTNCR